MNILQILQRLRDDLKIWTTNNLEALNKKIDDKTFPVDTKLSSTSKNPVQNKVINAELDDIKSKVGNTTVADQISAAIAKHPHFSGDYNDLINAPNIVEDDSGNLVITDDKGNIIFRVDAEGIHSTALSLDGKAAASEEYVNKAISHFATEEELNNALESLKTELGDGIESTSDSWKIVDEAGNIIFNVDEEGVQTTNLTIDGKQVATVEDVEEAFSNIEIPDIPEMPDLEPYATIKYVDDSISAADEQLRKDFGDGIESPNTEFQIVDSTGNIIFQIDDSGTHTTELTLNGEAAATEKYVDDAISKIPTPDVSGQINAHNTNEESHADIRQAIEDAKEELSESIVSESDEWKVVDEAGNIIFSLDAEGVHTTSLTLNDEKAATEAYVDDAIKNIPEIPQWVTDIKTKPGIAEWEQDDEHLTVSKAEKEMWDAKSDFSGSYNDLEDAPNITEDESNNLIVADTEGNIIFRADENGVETTQVIVDGVSIKDKDETLDTSAETIVGAINEINDKTIDKILALELISNATDTSNWGITCEGYSVIYRDEDEEEPTVSDLYLHLPIAAGNNVEFEFEELDEGNQVVKINSQVITEVSSEDYISNDTTKLYRYLDSEGNPSHIVEVVGSTGARSAGSEFTPQFGETVNTSEQLTPETLYGCFDHSLNGSLTISSTSQVYRLQYKDPEGNILTSGIRLGSSKNAGSITITPTEECTIRLIKYYTYVANTNTISGYDTNAAVSVSGDICLFEDDTTPLEITLKAGVEYTISTNPEGYSGRVILTSFSFGSASMHHHELARMDDVDAVKTVLLGTSNDKLGSKTTIYAAASGAMENKANIATNTSAIASLQKSVGDVQIWDAQTLPTAAAKYLNTLYKCKNTLHQCVTIGDGEQLIFPLAITGTSEIVPSHYAADGSLYTELGKDFKKYFTVDSITKGFRNGDSIKLGSSSSTGSIVLTSIAEEEITRIQVGVRAYNDNKSAFRVASGDLDMTWPIASKTEETLLSLYTDESASLGNTFTIETVDSITSTDSEGKEITTTYDKRGIITRIIVDFGIVSYEWRPINGGGLTDDPMLGTWVWNFDAEVTPVAELDAEFNFISYDDDGIKHDFSRIHIDCLINQEGTASDAYVISYYDSDDNRFIVCDYESGREESWHNELSKTIIINEQPSVELAAFIKTNATKQKETLHTKNQTVIGAINELHSQLGDIDVALDAILSQTHSIIGGEQ